MAASFRIITLFVTDAGECCDFLVFIRLKHIVMSFPVAREERFDMLKRGYLRKKPTLSIIMLVPGVKNK
jgi:hypothetical protein